MHRHINNNKKNAFNIDYVIYFSTFINPEKTLEFKMVKQVQLINFKKAQRNGYKITKIIINRLKNIWIFF